MAGLRERCNIYRISFPTDSASGGAIPSGTMTYSSVMCRIDAKMPMQALLQQGLETIKTFTAVLIPGTLDIRERDEIEPCFPYNHPYLNVRFRVTGFDHSDMIPFNPNSYVVVTLTRSEIAHANQ